MIYFFLINYYIILEHRVYVQDVFIMINVMMSWRWANLDFNWIYVWDLIENFKVLKTIVFFIYNRLYFYNNESTCNRSGSDDIVRRRDGRHQNVTAGRRQATRTKNIAAHTGNRVRWYKYMINRDWPFTIMKSNYSVLYVCNPILLIKLLK